MLKRSITYENLFTGEMVTEDYYFHISKADLVELELSKHKLEYKGKDGKMYTGMQAHLQQMVDAEDAEAIIGAIKNFIRLSYGKRDGDRFVKTQAIWDEFAASEAYSQLLFDLTTNVQASAEFVNGVFPKNMDKIAADIQAQVAEQTATEPANGTDSVAEPTNDEPRLLTQQQVIEMDGDELRSGLATGRYKLA